MFIYLKFWLNCCYIKKLKWQKITCLIFAKFIIRMENWINSFTYNFFIIKTEVFIFCYQDAR